MSLILKEKLELSQFYCYWQKFGPNLFIKLLSANTCSNLEQILGPKDNYTNKITLKTKRKVIFTSISKPSNQSKCISVVLVQDFQVLLLHPSRFSSWQNRWLNPETLICLMKILWGTTSILWISLTSHITDVVSVGLETAAK